MLKPGRGANARAGERDALNVQFEAFRKNLKELLGSADTAVGALNLPAPKPAADQGDQKAEKGRDTLLQPRHKSRKRRGWPASGSRRMRFDFKVLDHKEQSRD